MARIREKALEGVGPQPVNLDDIDPGFRPASEMRVGLNSEAIIAYAQTITELLSG